MEQPVGRIAQLRLYPIRPWWSLGSGWAAVSGGLAAGGLPLTPETLLNLLLVWLLADPLLGVIWDLGAGSSQASPGRGMWRQLLRPDLPETAAPVGRLPYTQAGSPGYRLAQRLGQLRAWWRATLRPEAGAEVASLAAALVLALLLGVVLGPSVLILIVVSVALSWLAALAEHRQVGGSHTRPEREVQGPAVWRALGEFSIPWLIGASIMGRVSGTVVLLAVCYSIAYFGLIRAGRGFPVTAASQATAALLLAGLRYPLAAGAAAILLMPQLGLFQLETRSQGMQPAPAPPLPLRALGTTRALGTMPFGPGSLFSRRAAGQNLVSNPPGGQPQESGRPPGSGQPQGSGRPQGSPLQSTAMHYVQPFIILSMILAALAIAP